MAQAWTDKELIAALAKGETLSDPARLTPGYRTELVRLMALLADSELAGAAGFADLINTAPSVIDRIQAARMVAEKFDHARLVLALLADFGVHPDLYLAEHAWSARIDRGADLGTRRIGGDKRLNVFHYPLQGWLDALVLEFLMGHASVIQLGDQAEGCYAPFARALKEIIAGEARHAGQGEAALRRALAGDVARAGVQAAVEYWHNRVADSFGRGESERFLLHQAYRLRHRPGSALLQEWRALIATKLAALALRAPD